MTTIFQALRRRRERKFRKYCETWNQVDDQLVNPDPAPVLDQVKSETEQLNQLKHQLEEEP
jgi:hypothetical protein